METKPTKNWTELCAQVDHLRKQGMPSKQACAQVGIADSMYYTKRAGYKGRKPKKTRHLTEIGGEDLQPKKRRYTRRSVAAKSRNGAQIANPDSQIPAPRFVKFCPDCGHYLAPYQIALKHAL